MSPTLFISYARANTAFAERLRGDLQARGATIWIDHERLTPGTPDWDAAIRIGIQAADAVIYLASPAALDSRNVQGELGVAQRFNKLIIPFWVDGEHWVDAAPLDMGRTQYVDARGPDYEEACARLCQRLGMAVTVELDVPTAAMASAGVPPDTSPDTPGTPPTLVAATSLAGTGLADTALAGTAAGVAPDSGAPALSARAQPDQPAPATHLLSMSPVPAPLREPSASTPPSLRPARRRGQVRSWLVAALAAVLVLGASGAGLLAWGTLNHRTSGQSAGAAATANARATVHAAQLYLAGATATADARFPYFAPAPGPGCDPNFLSWQHAFGDGSVQCVAGKTRLTTEATNLPWCAYYASISYAVDRGIVLPPHVTASVQASPSSKDTGVSLDVSFSGPQTTERNEYTLNVAGFGRWQVNADRVDNGPPGNYQDIAGGQIAPTHTYTLAATVDGTTLVFLLDGHTVASTPEPQGLTVTNITLGVNANCQPGGQADFSDFSLR